MADCTIDIVFEGDERHFEPGDKIVGAVRVSPAHDCTCERLAIHRQWVARSTSEVCRGGDDEIVLYEGSWSAGRVQEYPFIFHAPPGPYSHDGDLLELEWVLSARAQIEADEDLRAEQPLHIEPSGDEADFVLGEPETRDTTGEETSPLEMALEGLGGALLLIIGVWLIYPSVAAAPGASLWTLLSGVGSLAAGAWLMNRLVRRQWGHGGESNQHPGASDYHVAPGDHVSFVVDLEPNFRTRPRGITALLKGYEAVGSDDGSSGGELHRFYEEPISITPTDESGGDDGRPGSYRVDFRVPDDAPYSFWCRAAEIGWAIEVHVDVGSWPDWSRDFSLVVRPNVDAHESRPIGQRSSRHTGGE